jgi:hypothetical protein
MIIIDDGDAEYQCFSLEHRCSKSRLIAARMYMESFNEPNAAKALWAIMQKINVDIAVLEAVTA